MFQLKILADSRIGSLSLVLSCAVFVFMVLATVLLISTPGFAGAQHGGEDRASDPTIEVAHRVDTQIMELFAAKGAIYLDPLANLEEISSRSPSPASREGDPLRSDLRATIDEFVVRHRDIVQPSDAVLEQLLREEFFVEEAGVYVISDKEQLRILLGRLFQLEKGSDEVDPGEVRKKIASAGRWTRRVELSRLSFIKVGLSDAEAKGAVERLDLPWRSTKADLERMVSKRQQVQAWVFGLMFRVPVANSREGEALSRVASSVRDSAVALPGEDTAGVPEGAKPLYDELMKLLLKAELELPILKSASDGPDVLDRRRKEYSAWLDGGSEWEGLDRLREDHVRVMRTADEWLRSERASGSFAVQPAKELERRVYRLVSYLRNDIASRQGLDEESKVRLAKSFRAAVGGIDYDRSAAILSGAAAHSLNGGVVAKGHDEVAAPLHDLIIAGKETSLMKGLNESMSSERLAQNVAELVNHPPAEVVEELRTLRNALALDAGLSQNGEVLSEQAP